MIDVKIKPLSVNQAWKGRRYKTDDYKWYEFALMDKLPEKIDIPQGKLSIEITYGFSSRGSDLDNPTKPFLDVLQKKYNFNDSRFYKKVTRKEIVKKGCEFIKFSITEFKD